MLIIMLLALVLTLALPAYVSARSGLLPGLVKGFRWLAAGLLVQIAGEFALMALGYRQWIVYWECPFIIGRIALAGWLVRESRKIERGSTLSTLSLNTSVANLALWFVILVRWLQRI